MFVRTRTIDLFCAVLVFLISFLSLPIREVLAVPSYNIVTLGLTDSEHTRVNGDQFSYGEQLNEAGKVRGYSERYNGGSTDLGQTAWLYDGTATIDVGHYDTEHTRDDGYQLSISYQLNELGQVSGDSRRFNGGSTDFGRTAWLYDGISTVDIGHYDTEHTRDDGYQRSYVDQLNEAGQVRGWSRRYNGGSAVLGGTAWLYDGTSTVDVGHYDAMYTASDGFQASGSEQLNEAGQVIGWSYRYNGGNSENLQGLTVWLYNGNTTVDIGLYDTMHTASTGYQESYVHQLNEAGQVIGLSYRYSGNTYLGWTAWLYDGAAEVVIGHYDSEHTRGNGFQLSRASQLNEAGQVSGYSLRYNGGSTGLGQTAWLYDGTATIDVGHYLTEHTRNDGYQYSETSQLNEAGQVVGYSLRYNGGSTDLGQTTWLYDGTATIDVGHYDVEHTRADGYRYSGASQLNEAGQVIGFSRRYNGGSGHTAWLYDGATMVDVGLYDAMHTSYYGDQQSVVEQLNEPGQVTGHSTRYNGGDEILGSTAWFYDSLLDQTFVFELSTHSDGSAYSRIQYLGEDGLALGTYMLYDSLDNSLGRHAFSFTTDDGVHDLGPLVDGGLSANGWDRLATALRGNGLGQILGAGKLSSQSGGTMAYLLTPIPALTADFDGDGDVDGDDLTDPVDGWEARFGVDLDGFDFLEWQVQFGSGVSPSFAAQVIPEPRSMLLVATVGLLFCTGRRRFIIRCPLPTLEIDRSYDAPE